MKALRQQAGYAFHAHPTWGRPSPPSTGQYSTKNLLARMLSLQDYKYFQGLYEITHGGEEPDIRGLFRQGATSEKNQRLLAELKEDDRG